MASPEFLKNTAKMKANAIGHYNLNGRSVISFPENSRWESIISFIRKVRKNNPAKAVIIVLDNLKSHKMENVKAEAERLGIELVFLPSYSPRPKSDRMRLEGHKEGYINNLCKACR